MGQADTKLTWFRRNLRLHHLGNVLLKYFWQEAMLPGQQTPASRKLQQHFKTVRTPDARRSSVALLPPVPDATESRSGADGN